MAEVRRDRWGRYLVVPPNGGAPTGYTRATTVAKALDDGGGLIPWKATATVVGAMRRPGLHARWQSLINEHPDPWYATEDSKKACKALVEECATAGGSTDRADLGTALHAIIEQSQKAAGTGVPILQPAMQADIDAYKRTMDSAGIIIDPTMVEAMIVLDEHQVAGMSDNLSVHAGSYGNVVADLKTGTDLKYSWQAIAIQLAIYAHADNVYRQGAAANGGQDERLPMPELNQEVGLVIHLPAGEARCELHLIDLVAGWEAFQQSMWTRRWRTHRTLARPFPIGAPVPIPDFDAAPVASTPPEPEPATAPEATSATSTSHAPSNAGPAGTGRTATPTVPATNEPPDFDAVAITTPTTPPPSVTSDSDGGATAPVPSVALSPADQHAAIATNPDEGGPADGDALNLLEQNYKQLPDKARAWIAHFATEAIQHHVSFHVKGNRTRRRFELLRGLVILAGADSIDDESIRHVLEACIGDPAHHPAVTIGHLIGSLDAGRAATFAVCCDEFVNGVVQSTVIDGRVRLIFTSLTAQAA